MNLTSVSRGNGEPLVLLHAFPLSHQLWQDLVPPAGFELILPDFPGFGFSSLAEEGYQMGDAAQDLEIHLKNKGFSGKISIGGISMGGYWALEYFRQFPSRVSRLILMSTRAGSDSLEGQKKRLDTAERVEREGAVFLADAMVPGLLGKTTLSESPAKVEQVRKWILEAPPRAIALAQRSMAARRDQVDLLSSIRVKTLILAGREDALIPFAEAEKMAAGISGSRLELLDGMGHLPPLENPERFQKSLNQFLAS